MKLRPGRGLVETARTESDLLIAIGSTLGLCKEHIGKELGKTRLYSRTRIVFLP